MRKRKSPSHSSWSPLSICMYALYVVEPVRAENVDGMVNFWTTLATPRSWETPSAVHDLEVMWLE